MESSKQITPSAIELLPLEVIDVIGKYLSVKDLNACCATSSSMRNIFSDNILWKPRCNKDLADYLKNTPCKVKPTFVSPENDGTNLNAVSEWRMSHMRENHLWNNWRRGRYTEQIITNCESDESTGAMDHRFLTNDYVVALFRENMTILDFDYTGKPTTIYFPFSSDDVEIINTGCDMIVTLLKSCVQVYCNQNAAKETYFLKHSFFFEDSLKLENKTPSEINKIYDLKKSSQPSFLVYSVLQTFFVGSLSNESTIHIWNLETGLKLKEEVCPMKDSSVQEIKASDTMVLGLRVNEKGKCSNTFLIYSLKTLSYLPFKMSFSEESCEFNITNDLIAVCSTHHVYIFNYLTSKPLLRDSLIQYPPQVMKNTLLLIQNEELKWFDRSNRVFKLLPLKGAVTCIQILSNRYVKVERDGKYEIWEIKGMFKSCQKTSLEFWFMPFKIFLNKVSSKFIVSYYDDEKGVATLVNFW